MLTHEFVSKTLELATIWGLSDMETDKSKKEELRSIWQDKYTALLDELRSGGIENLNRRTS